MKNKTKNYYSENWADATKKFISAAEKFGDIKFEKHPTSDFNIPYVSIGTGENLVVINSGVHGIEGYFGSATQLMFLSEFAPKLSSNVLKKYKIVLIHIINGWGMENRTREVLDPNGGMVDLNRNFGVDFSNPNKLPKNEKYNKVHDILLSQPHVARGEKTKMIKLMEFRRGNLDNGVWGSIMRGQYKYPYGLAYGGASQMPENKMTMAIYDNIMDGAKSLISIGLHTGCGRFYKKRGFATCELQVSHPAAHENSKKFVQIFGDDIKMENIVSIENGVPTTNILGDLVDCIEQRFEHLNIPIYTADFEIGTGETAIRSQVLKRMDMGDARYDLKNTGKINPITRKNLTESWYPSHPDWRRSAMESSKIFLEKLTEYMNKNSK